MKDNVLHPRIMEARAEAWPPPNRPGESFVLSLPDEFYKEVYETLVWSGDGSHRERAFYKMYRHRGRFSWWQESLTVFRAQREYRSLRALFRAGVPCAEPLLCGRGVSPEHGRYEILITREIPHARQLRLVLESARDGGRLPELAPLFKTIRAMHAAGLYHGTLTPNNIVISVPPSGPARFHLVDLPRAVVFPYDLAGTSMARYDLLHFFHRTAPYVGRERCRPLLAEYGFSDRDTARFLRDLDGYRPGKWLRYRLRNEFGWRARLAR